MDKNNNQEALSYGSLNKLHELADNNSKKKSPVKGKVEKKQTANKLRDSKSEDRVTQLKGTN